MVTQKCVRKECSNVVLGNIRLGDFGDLLGKWVDVLARGNDVSICVHTIIWHMCGYLWCHSNLARVRGDAFSI